MLVSAAVCPHPPALVPALSQGSAGLLDDVRTASIDAVRALVAVDHDVLVCVGAGAGTTRWGPEAGGSLRAFGVDVGFGGAEHVLPPSLTVAAYLIEAAGVAGSVAFQSIAAGASPDACDAVGDALAAEAGRVALLVMGDGSAKRSRLSPGYLDVRAEDFDAGTARALGEPDPAALLSIDPELAADLWVAGRPSWQVLAGAIASSSGPLRGDVRYDGAPLGVGYVVVLLTSA